VKPFAYVRVADAAGATKAVSEAPGAAFLGGYSMTIRGRSWFHMFALTLAVTLTIYATLEIEYPREGLIRLTDTDKTLITLRNSMD